MIRKRLSSGQTLPLTVVLIVVIVMIGIAFLFYQFILGGNRELANAVDAGNLNVAKVAMKTPEVKLSELIAKNPECAQFDGVAEKNASGELVITLGSINRVWAQSLMVALNAQSLNTPTAWENSRQVYLAAKDASKALSDKIKGDQLGLRTAFTDFAAANPLRMLNPQAGALRPTVATPQLSYVDRPPPAPAEPSVSNIYFEGNQGLPLADKLVAETPGPVRDERNYIAGYKVFRLDVDGDGNPEPFVFVPLEHGKKPHLISRSVFTPNQNEDFLPGGPNGLRGVIAPNAFSFSANVRDTRSGVDALQQSFAVAKERGDGHPAEMPHGFVRIRNMPGKDMGFSGETGENALHVLEYSNRVVGQAYQIAFEGPKDGPLGGGLMYKSDDGMRNLYARTMLNTLDIPTGTVIHLNPINMIRVVGCATSGSWTAFPTGSLLRWLECGLRLSTFAFNHGPLITWGHDLQGNTQPAPGESPQRFLDRFGPKFSYAYTPAVGLKDKDFWRNYEERRIQILGIHDGLSKMRIRPGNVWRYRIFFDWERGKYFPTIIGNFIWAMIQANVDVDIGREGPNGTDPKQLISALGQWALTKIDGGMMLSFLLHAATPTSWDINRRDLMKFDTLLPADAVESGMRVREAEGGGHEGLESLFWDGRTASQKRTITKDGTIRELVGDRRNKTSLKDMFTAFKKRIRQISPVLSDGEIDQVLASNKVLPMGKSAFIFIGDDGKLQVAIEGESLPAWLQKVKDAQPDCEPSAIAETEYIMADSLRCHPLVQISEDWHGYESWSHDDIYPARVCLRDTYKFLPSSGRNGMLAVLELRARIEKKCKFPADAHHPTPGHWIEPQECFQNDEAFADSDEPDSYPTVPPP